MNARILELIKSPELIQKPDLALLDSEIAKQPYIQNIRALHLYGTHLFEQENYQKVLSTTAAYTTDKKILYQFITKKVTEEIKPEIPVVEEKKVVEEEISAPKTSFESIEINDVEAPKPVFVEGELNRILFEGEEDFLQKENVVIDLESTLESGKIVTQNTDFKNDTNNAIVQIDDEISAETANQNQPIEIVNEVVNNETQIPEKIEENESVTETKEFVEVPDAENYSKEKIIHESEISLVTATVENPAEVSFHVMDEFLPEVKITANIEEAKIQQAPKPQLSKHEEEMQKLIAEVEAKMQKNKKEKLPEDEPVHNNDLNFSETQSFEVASPTILPEKKMEHENNLVSNTDENPTTENKTDEPIHKIEESIPNVETREWKPMQISASVPDSLISKKTETKTVDNKPSEIPQKIEEKKTIETKSEERPVFNVSFFSQDVAPISTQKTEEKPEEKIVEENITPTDSETSNVPNFINTWQNWLKIERKEEKIEEKPEISKEEVKNQVIEKFIVEEPKISKLKEETNFVVKEKSDNISHLMTETLANLYVEQKLYAKAIKGFEILSEKHPDKKDQFEERIKEIKEIRKNQ